MLYLYILLSPLWIPATLLHHLWRALRAPAYLERWHWRLGLGWRGVRPGSVWLSCVSLGEVRTAAPLARRLLDETDHPLLLTATTPTGLAEIRRQFSDRADRVQWRWTPLDTPLCLRLALRGRRPLLYLAMESEIWPSSLRHLKAGGVPLALANARLSDRSLRRLRGPLRGVFARLLGSLDAVVARSCEDAARLVAAGVVADRQRLAPELKFAGQAQAAAARRNSGKLRARLGVAEDLRIAVAGSTHPGEDALLARAWKQAVEGEADPSLLVVAPRHPEDFAACQRRLRAMGLSVARYSAPPLPPGSRVLVLDRLGVLTDFYAIARCAFVGGSALPGLRGHNLAEPAAFGIPAACGPHHSNFRAMAASLREEGALQVLEGEAEIADFFRRALAPTRAGSDSGAGQAVERLGRRSLDLHLAALRELLP